MMVIMLSKKIESSGSNELENFKLNRTEQESLRAYFYLVVSNS